MIAKLLNGLDNLPASPLICGKESFLEIIKASLTKLMLHAEEKWMPLVTTLERKTLSVTLRLRL